MGIIGRNSEQDSSRGGTTVIAAGTSLVGDLTLNDSLHVDGNMQGDVTSNSDVSIGRNGQFDGNIQAKHVVVSGNFKGGINCDRLEIVADGRVTGDLETEELVIEAGARFSGASRIKDEDPRQLPYQPDEAGEATLLEGVAE